MPNWVLNRANLLGGFAVLLAGLYATPSTAQVTGPLTPSFSDRPPPPGMIQMTSPASSSTYSLGNTASLSHGYVATGISTGGGAGLDGAVTVPVLPDKIDVTVGGGTGQIQTLSAPWSKHGTALARYNNVHAQVDAKLDDNTHVSFGFSDTSVKLPQ